MSLLEVIDETFVVATPTQLRGRLCDERMWAGWFPDLRLSCRKDRGSDGKRWDVSGALRGTAEVWLEAFADGTVVHAFLRLDPAGSHRADRKRLVAAYALPLKAHVRAIKDELELGRAPGEPRMAAVTE